MPKCSVCARRVRNTSDEVSPFVVPQRGQVQTLSRVQYPSDVTLLTGGGQFYISSFIAASRRPCETLSKVTRQSAIASSVRLSRITSDKVLALTNNRQS